MLDGRPEDGLRSNNNHNNRGIRLDEHQERHMDGNLDGNLDNVLDRGLSYRPRHTYDTDRRTK